MPCQGSSNRRCNGRENLIMSDVQARFQELHAAQSTLNFYALVDGYQYEQHTGQRLERHYGINRAIFDGTQDQPLAHAGPWLIDVGNSPEQVQRLAELEQALPSVSWIITPIDLEGLAQLLQLKLDAQLPDGKKALVRFYDPRVLGNIFHTMTIEQRAEFFYLIEEWHFMYNGRRVWTGRNNA
jgi:uncharacterized protein DUF4123